MFGSLISDDVISFQLLPSLRESGANVYITELSGKYPLVVVCDDIA